MDDQSNEPEENQEQKRSDTSQEMPEQDGATQTSVIEQPMEAIPVAPPPKKRFSRKQVFVTASVVFLIAAVVVAMLIVQKSKPKDTSNQSQTEQTTSEEASEQTDNDQSTPTFDSVTVLSDNTYLTSPKDLGNLNFFKDPETYFGFSDAESKAPNVTSEQIEYRQIGTTADGQQIIVYTTNLSDFGGIMWNYALGKDSKYELLEGINPIVGASSSDRDGWYSEMQKALSENVTIDRVTTLKELDFPEDTKINGQPISGTGSAYYLENGKDSISEGQKNLTSLGEVDGLEILRHVSRDETNFQLISMYGVFKNIFASSYDIKGEVSSSTDNELAITWTKGEQTTAKYFSQGPGCGTDGYILPKNVKASDLTQVGKTPKGQKVYQLSSSHGFTKYLYDEDYDKSGEYGNSPDLANLTIDQFADKHAYFIIENSFSEFMAFIRQDMFIRGGCGKPVIYLYPTADTLVDVAVDADVVISEPFYEAKGWQDVNARPDGNLTYRGNSYDSLYWEGYGHGPYPDLRKVGRIVTQKAVREAIVEDLVKLGLNEKERTDFMEFWEPRLPSDPYVKLSWMNTVQMNQLAPLHVSPSPQTTIRVFLEFEGLDKPVSLSAQKLSSIPRRGFTLVEWGGLLREGVSQ